LPIPGNEISLDGDALISDANEMKNKLREELFDLLEKTNIETLSQKDSTLQDNLYQQLGQFPLLPTIR
jgi:hypothetical protein